MKAQIESIIASNGGTPKNDGYSFASYTNASTACKEIRSEFPIVLLAMPVVVGRLVCCVMEGSHDDYKSTGVPKKMKWRIHKRIIAGGHLYNVHKDVDLPFQPRKELTLTGLDQLPIGRNYSEDKIESVEYDYNLKRFDVYVTDCDYDEVCQDDVLGNLSVARVYNSQWSWPKPTLGCPLCRGEGLVSGIVCPTCGGESVDNVSSPTIVQGLGESS